jgi:hypothetical protein
VVGEGSPAKWKLADRVAANANALILLPLLGPQPTWRGLLLVSSGSKMDPEQTQPSPMQRIRVVSMTRTRCGCAWGAR